MKFAKRLAWRERMKSPASAKPVATDATSSASPASSGASGSLTSSRAPIATPSSVTTATAGSSQTIPPSP